MAQFAMKRALMIAFHYPPCTGSSGIQRTLSFSRYLPSTGWQPVVLSANQGAYPTSSEDQLADIPCDVPVIRALALDTARHLSIKGRYWSALALPDRWISWYLPGVIAALRAVHRYKPDVIWSTYPIPTAHLIAKTVHRLTGIPWVADFRDSMTEADYPTDERKRRVYRKIEKRVIATASHCVFTAPGTKRMYAARYPDIDDSRWSCIINGYDELAYEKAEADAIPAGNPDRTVLLHSGLLYPVERDPTAFFEAIRMLKHEDDFDVSGLEIRLRASGFEADYQARLQDLQIDDIVTLPPPVGYVDAITEMMQADGLLIFQASNCNHQIPAKAYEYFRAKRPVLALTDPAGDTAALLRRNATNKLARLDSSVEIVGAIKEFLTMLRDDGWRPLPEEEIARFSRGYQTQALGQLFDCLAGGDKQHNAN